LLPANILDRFTTYFHAQSGATEEAAESASTRKLLLSKSLELTLKHPVLGVGPGEFMEGEAKEAAEKGQRGIWHYTHNSYTELSSECGILGLMLYVIALWKAFFGLSWIRKRFPSASTRRAALFVQITVLMTAVGAFFLSIAYGGILYAILGLSAAFQMAATREYKEQQLAASA
jgi:O-antigen ligase